MHITLVPNSGVCRASASKNQQISAFLPITSSFARPAPLFAFRFVPWQALTTTGASHARPLTLLQCALGEGGTESRDEGGTESSTSESAVQTVERCVQLFQASKQNELLDLVPEHVLDTVIAKNKDKDEAGIPWKLTLQLALDTADTSDFHFDSFAMRGMMLTPPTRVQLLSSFMVSPERFLQRYAVTAASGEEMCLTFEMTLMESLQAQYKSVRLVNKWFLRKITGEPDDPDLPEAPHPSHGPEAVVLAQLDALRQEDVETAFRFASNENQGMTGPVEKFKVMLESSVYRPLLGHSRSAILRSVQLTQTRTMVLVGISTSTPASQSNPARLVYSWVMGLQAEDAGATGNCWMTEAVQLISQGLML